jgi:hypothetical protein
MKTLILICCLVSFGAFAQPIRPNRYTTNTDGTAIPIIGTTGTFSGALSGTGSGPGGFSLTNNSTGSGWLLTNNTLIYLSNGVVITVVADAITNTTLTPSTALVANANQALASSVTTSTELSYVHGVTSAIQTQLNALGAASNILAGTGITVTPSGGNATVAVSAYVNTNNASQLSSGTVADARLSSNVPFLNGSPNADNFSAAISNSSTLLVNGAVGFGSSLTENGLFTGETYNTSSYTAKFGSFLIQPYAFNNGFLAENAYYNGGYTRLQSGYAEAFQFINGSIQFFTITTGTGGFSQNMQFKTDFTGGMGLGGVSMSSSGAGNYGGAAMIIGATGAVTTGSITVTNGFNQFGVTSVGNSEEQVVGLYVNTNVTGNVASTLLFTNSTANTIRGTVHYNASVLVAAAAGTFTIAIAGTNDFGQAYTITPFSALSTAATGPLDLTLTVPDSFNFTLGASKSLTMTATIGGTGSPTVDLGIWTDRALNQ